MEDRVTAMTCVYPNLVETFINMRKLLNRNPYEFALHSNSLNQFSEAERYNYCGVFSRSIGAYEATSASLYFTLA